MSQPFDVRTKLLLLVAANYLLLRRTAGWVEWLFVALLLGLFWWSGYAKKALRFGSIFVALSIADYWLLDGLTGHNASFVSMLAVGGRLMFPCFMAGNYLLSTTPVIELMHLLRRWRLPETVVLAFAGMMRFLPTIKGDYRAIRQALLLRGLFLKRVDIVCHPVRFFEQVLVPLVLSAARTAQDLTVATVTKAAGSVARKTAYQPLRWRVRDTVLALVLVFLFGVSEVWP